MWNNVYEGGKNFKKSGAYNDSKMDYDTKDWKHCNDCTDRKGKSGVTFN